MASDFTKPDHVHTLWKSEMSEKCGIFRWMICFMWAMPLYTSWKIGISYDWRTGSYGSCNFARAYEVTGNTYLAICNGIDESAVISSPPPAKGYGNSLTTPYDVMDCETARQYLLSLSETISARLRADGVKISVVSISLKDWDLRFTDIKLHYLFQRIWPWKFMLQPVGVYLNCGMGFRCGISGSIPAVYHQIPFARCNFWNDRLWKIPEDGENCGSDTEKVWNG